MVAEEGADHGAWGIGETERESESEREREREEGTGTYECFLRNSGTYG